MGRDPLQGKGLLKKSGCDNIYGDRLKGLLKINPTLATAGVWWTR
jgi:hypothetical protein